MVPDPGLQRPGFSVAPFCELRRACARSLGNHEPRWDLPRPEGSSDILVPMSEEPGDPNRPARDAINATLYDRLSFNFIRDIAPVATIIRQPLLMVVNPSIPAKTVPDFIAYAKANPGKVNMASTGNGTAPHVTGELFKMMAGIDM